MTPPRTESQKCGQQKTRPAMQAGFSFSSSEESANLSFHFSFNATVDLATFLGAVVSNRTGLAVTDGVDALAFHAVLVDQHVANSFGTTLGQTLVVLVGTDGVGVTFNSGAGLRVLLHEVGQVLDVAVAFFTYAGLVEVELHIQLDTDQFRLRLRLGVDDGGRCWLGSRLDLSDLASTTTEVQTHAHARHPLAVAGIDVVHTVDASLGEQVLGGVVLQAGTDVGEGAVVTTAAGLADALVSHACGKVGTQTHTRLTEVVNRVERGEAALDVLVGTVVDRIVSRHVVIFTIGQAQGNIVGEEVADSGAIQLTFVFEVAGAVGEVVLAKRLYLYGALPLGECAGGRGGQYRANYNAQGVFSFHP